MNLDRVGPGRDAPAEFNVIIEIPMNADPIKYEVDKETGALFVDRFMMTAMHCPCNYGYIPRTIAGDGDPIDKVLPIYKHWREATDLQPELLAQIQHFARFDEATPKPTY
jgi:inorganic pyrophosphatase